MQDQPSSATSRTSALAWLIVLLFGQAFVVLATLVVAGLGGASPMQAAILFGGVGVAAALLLVLLVQEFRRAWRPVVAVWALAVPLIDVAAYAIVLGAAGGLSACDATDEATLRSVSAPPGVEFQGEPGNNGGSCAQAFVASVPLEDVLVGYRTALRSDGWSILSQDARPGFAEGGASAESGELSAQRGTARFWVEIESGPGEAGGTYVGGSLTADTIAGGS
jgi:hypothetical protein